MTENVKHPVVTPVTIKLDGTVVDIVDWYKDIIDVRTFIERLASSFDLEVVFQRDQVWTDEMKALLINSIMNGTPIGSCLLCEKPTNVADKNVIDFKNRSLAIRDFWQGKFSISFLIETEPGKYKEERMTWPQLCESQDSQLKNIKQKFETYKIDCVVYRGMNLVQQAKKFLTVNTQMPMKNEELLYGYNFWTKGFANLVYELCLKQVCQHTRDQQVKNNYRQKGTVFAHRIFFTCFGPKLRDVWAVRDLGISKDKILEVAAQELNEELAGVLEEKGVYKMDVEFLKSTKYWVKLEVLKKCSNAISNILNYNIKLKKNLKKNDIFDCIIFFMKKISEDRLTFSMLQDNQGLYFRIICEYIRQKKDNANLTGQSITTKKIQERMDLMEKIWKSNVEDDGFKNKKPTQDEIMFASLDSDGKCPITGESITELNGIIEHVNPKSKCSETQYVLATNVGNQWKSNRTLEENKQVLKYQETQKKNEN